MKKTNKSFGSNLKEIMDFLDMTQADLADLSGETRAAICMILKDERDPLLSTVVKILKVIPVKFERLVEGLYCEKDPK